MPRALLALTVLALAGLASAAKIQLPCEKITGIAGCVECRSTPTKECYLCQRALSPVWTPAGKIRQASRAGERLKDLRKLNRSLAADLRTAGCSISGSCAAVCQLGRCRMHETPALFVRLCYLSTRPQAAACMYTLMELLHPRCSGHRPFEPAGALQAAQFPTQKPVHLHDPPSLSRRSLPGRLLHCLQCKATIVGPNCKKAAADNNCVRCDGTVPQWCACPRTASQHESRGIGARAPRTSDSRHGVCSARAAAATLWGRARQPGLCKRHQHRCLPVADLQAAPARRLQVHRVRSGDAL